MVSQNILRKYAQLAVVMGSNVQPGQTLMIQADTDSNYFVRLCVEEAYKAGAKEVLVEWNDQLTSRIHYDHASTETLKEVKSYILDKTQYWMDNKICRLNVYSPIPGLLEGVDPQKIQEVAIAQMAPKVRQEFKQFSMANKTQWCLISIPNKQWAEKCFPNETCEKAIELLWHSILSAVHVNEDNDPISVWVEHNKVLHAHNEALNNFNFKSLHFKNSKGTDLEVGLVKDHIWCGGSEISQNGVEFNPNMPTEESFTMPDRERVYGRVYSTKPLNYGGVLIDEFWLEFNDGKVVDFDAKENRETLARLLDFDEGSRHIGEIALISDDSPISNSKVLFYNTLFDENASCHMALGAAYPMNVKGGLQMNEEELFEAKANRSSQHEDFMFGSSDMEIIGETYDKEMIQVFKDGNFVF